MDNWTACAFYSVVRYFVSAVLSDSSTIIKRADKGRAKRFLRLRFVDALSTIAVGGRRSQRLKEGTRMIGLGAAAQAETKRSAVSTDRYRL